jgi:formamidopyrimidine-DNA glycosylase
MMPELPELEIVAEVLSHRLVGRTIEKVAIEPPGGPIILRNLLDVDLATTIEGLALTSITRRGKYLLLELDPGAFILAINPKLTGRLQLCLPGAKKAGPVHVVFHFREPSEELRYVDRKRMGQIYLVKNASDIPGFEQLGVEALAITKEEFLARIRSFRGEIKGVLTRGSLVAGIGNAYADEILWAAQIHPYRKRASLDADEIDRLYDSMRSVLLESIKKVRDLMGEDIHRKPRDFFAVHMKAGEACPRCGSRISSVTANQRITNFCRTCQPGGLIQGM